MRKSLSDAALKKILETTNERDLFIVGHMYIENVIDRILEKKFNIPSKSIDSTLFTLNLKMDILTESGLIKGNVKKNVELLARIRNRYAHKLEPNEQRIGNYIRELHYLGPAPKLTGMDRKFEKYRFCVIKTFSVLEKMLRK
ncbi:uncharacterized protein METZ01_LOCUS203501 [marine metagenome]|jgi:hypothetical protein|uniref:DUF4145 domain-containing protein n=1 Tax=marine metagenome TaxID=408172 RepID=A0A382EL71_9ZZZZ